MLVKPDKSQLIETWHDGRLGKGESSPRGTGGMRGCSDWWTALCSGWLSSCPSSSCVAKAQGLPNFWKSIYNYWSEKPQHSRIVAISRNKPARAHFWGQPRSHRRGGEALPFFERYDSNGWTQLPPLAPARWCHRWCGLGECPQWDAINQEDPDGIAK